MSAALALNYDDWIPCDGGPCPIHGDTMVFIRYRNGNEIGPVQAKTRRWQRWPKDVGKGGLTSFDVKFYKLAGGDA